MWTGSRGGWGMEAAASDGRGLLLVLAVAAGWS